MLIDAHQLHAVKPVQEQRSDQKILSSKGTGSNNKTHTINFGIETEDGMPCQQWHIPCKQLLLSGWAQNILIVYFHNSASHDTDSFENSSTDSHNPTEIPNERYVIMGGLVSHNVYYTDIHYRKVVSMLEQAWKCSPTTALMLDQLATKLDTLSFVQFYQGRPQARFSASQTQVPLKRGRLVGGTETEWDKKLMLSVMMLSVMKLIQLIFAFLETT